MKFDIRVTIDIDVKIDLYRDRTKNHRRQVDLG